MLVSLAQKSLASGGQRLLLYSAVAGSTPVQVYSIHVYVTRVRLPRSGTSVTPTVLITAGLEGTVHALLNCIGDSETVFERYIVQEPGSLPVLTITESLPKLRARS